MIMLIIVITHTQHVPPYLGLSPGSVYDGEFAENDMKAGTSITSHNTSVSYLHTSRV